jgi:hypothetical protein
MAAFKPLMASKMRSMAASAAAELVAASSAPHAPSVSASRQRAAHLNLNSVVSDLEGRIGRCAVLTLAFNSDASLLIAGTADWRLAGWALVPATQSRAAYPLDSSVPPLPRTLSLAAAFELSGIHTGAVVSVGIVGDGSVIYTSGADSLIRLWQTSKLLPASPSSGAVESELSGATSHPAFITAVCAAHRVGGVVCVLVVAVVVVCVRVGGGDTFKQARLAHVNTQASVAGGGFNRLCEDPRGGSLVAVHEAFRGLFDYSLAGLPYGVPKADIAIASTVDAAVTVYGQTGAPRTASCFRLAATPPPPARQVSARGGDSTTAGSLAASSAQGSPSRQLSPRRAGPASPRKSPRPGAGRPALHMPLGSPRSTSGAGASPTPHPRTPLHQLPEGAGTDRAAPAPGTPVFSPPRTAAARALDQSNSNPGLPGGGSSSLEPDATTALNASGASSDSEDEDLLPLALRKPRLTAGSLTGDGDHDAGQHAGSADEPLVSGLDGASTAEGGESWWAGNTDPATWHDIEPTAVPYAVLQVRWRPAPGAHRHARMHARTHTHPRFLVHQGLVDLLDGKRSSASRHPAPPRSPGAIAAAVAAAVATAGSAAAEAAAGEPVALPVPLEPTLLRTVRRACIDVEPLTLSAVEQRSRKNRPPAATASAGGTSSSGAAKGPTDLLVSYSRACFVWDAAASTALYCSGAEVTLHDALTGNQRVLRLRSWLDIERAGAAAHQQRTTAVAQRRASTGDAHLLLMASPMKPTRELLGPSPSAVAAAASKRRRAVRGTLLHLSSDGLLLLTGLADCSIGVWQRSTAAASAAWEQVAVLLPPWVNRVEQAAAAVGRAQMRRASLLRRASIGGGSATTRSENDPEFSPIGSGGVLADVSIGPSGMFVAATFVKHSAAGGGKGSGGRTFRVLVAFWDVADILRVRRDDSVTQLSRAPLLTLYITLLPLPPCSPLNLLLCSKWKTRVSQR